MERKKIDLSKRHNSAFFKYSNQEVFDRREKQFVKDKHKYHKKLYTYYPLTSRNHYANLKQKFFREKNILLYLKTLQTLNTNENEDNKCYFQTIQYYDELEKNLTKNKRKKFMKKNISTKNNKNNFFSLTEANNIKRRKILSNNHSTKNYYTINYNRIFDDNKSKIEKKKKIKNFNDYNYKGIKELLLIRKEKERNDLKYKENMIKMNKLKDIKNMQYNRIKESSKYYIDKIHKYDMINYSLNVKKERAICLEEVYNNQFEYYKYIYSKLINSRKLLDVHFSIKTFEYLKYLSIKIHLEKIENLKLLNTILNYKNDIENINSKIKKMEYEKSNIIKWFYLQIQLKEKKLILPEYYKAIFEYNNNINVRRSAKPTIKRDQLNDKKDKNRSTKRMSLFVVNNINSNSNNHIENNTNPNINKKEKEKNKIEINGVKIKIEEYERLKQYKTKLIFSNPEAFNEALLNIQNNTLKLINYLDVLREQLFTLKKVYNKVKKEEEILDNSINTKLIYKENELKSIKSITNERINSGNGDTHKKKKLLSEEDNKNKKMLLYKKILNIYKNCKTVQNIEINIDENESGKKINVEEEMINMLKYIEIKIDIIINKVNSYIKGNDKTSFEKCIMKLKYEIDKQHKSEKAKMIKNKQIEKFKKLYDRIQERNNKILVLPKKKLDISRLKVKNKKVIEIKKEIQEEKNLEDFIDN